MIDIRIDKRIFNETFYPLINDNEHSLILLLGGGSSGKSYFSFQRCLYRCLIDVRKYLIVRNSAVDLQRSCWEDVISAISFFHISDLVDINKSNKTIKFVNGSQILFMGLDDDSKVKSIPNITDIIVEECSEINLDKFSQLKQRLRGNGKLMNQMVIQCNPVSKANWVYKHFFENGCKEDNCLIHRSTYKDNKFCNAPTIKALEDYKVTNPLYYRIYCLGEWGSLGKPIYSNWKVEDFDFTKVGGSLCIGMDFGFITSLTTIVCSMIDVENKKIYVFKEFGRTGLTNDKIAQIIKNMGLQKEIIVADSAEPKSIEELKRNGIIKIRPSKKGPDSVIHGIQKVQQYEIIVHPDCEGIITDLENYSYKKDRQTNEYINEPDKDEYDPHYLDALRYSLQIIDNSKMLKTIDKKKIGIY